VVKWENQAYAQFGIHLTNVEERRKALRVIGQSVMAEDAPAIPAGTFFMSAQILFFFFLKKKKGTDE
jgi:hypothetical protein